MCILARFYKTRACYLLILVRREEEAQVEVAQVEVAQVEVAQVEVGGTGGGGGGNGTPFSLVYLQQEPIYHDVNYVEGISNMKLLGYGAF